MTVTSSLSLPSFISLNQEPFLHVVSHVLDDPVQVLSPLLLPPVGKVLDHLLLDVVHVEARATDGHRGKRHLVEQTYVMMRRVLVKDIVVYGTSSQQTACGKVIQFRVVSHSMVCWSGMIGHLGDWLGCVLEGGHHRLPSPLFPALTG